MMFISSAPSSSRGEPPPAFLVDSRSAHQESLPWEEEILAGLRVGKGRPTLTEASKANLTT